MDPFVNRAIVNLVDSPLGPLFAIHISEYEEEGEPVTGIVVTLEVVTSFKVFKEALNGDSLHSDDFFTKRVYSQIESIFQEGFLKSELERISNKEARKMEVHHS